MKKRFYNLSNPQKSLLLTEQYFQGSNINNICGTAIIDNILDFKSLEKAINEVIEKNDSFLTKLEKKDGAYVQTINEYKYTKVRPIERVAPGIVTRKSVHEPLKTGLIQMR